MNQVEVRNLNKSYYIGKEEFKVLKDVNISFNYGEFVAIYGESGSGKSTFMNVLGGLDTYDSGEILINGENISKFTSKSMDYYRNRKIGFIFQEFKLLENLTVLENVMMPLSIAGVSTKEAKSRAKELLIQVGLESHIKKRAQNLSGGQKQRVAIARALANDPDIILADEPTGALDSMTTVEILELLKKIAESGKLVLSITHSEEVAKFGNRVVTLVDGKFVEETGTRVNVTKAEATVNTKNNTSKLSNRKAFKIARSNLLSKKFRTLLVSIGVSLGITGALVITSISESAIEEVVKTFSTYDLVEEHVGVSLMKESDMTNMNAGIYTGNVNLDEEIEVLEEVFSSYKGFEGIYPEYFLATVANENMFGGGEQVPTEEVPAEGAPTEEVPAEGAPTEEVPVESAPAEEVSVEEDVNVTSQQEGSVEVSVSNEGSGFIVVEQEEESAQEALIYFAAVSYVPSDDIKMSYGTFPTNERELYFSGSGNDLPFVLNLIDKPKVLDQEVLAEVDYSNKNDRYYEVEEIIEKEIIGSKFTVMIGEDEVEFTITGSLELTNAAMNVSELLLPIEANEQFVEDYKYEFKLFRYFIGFETEDDATVLVDKLSTDGEIKSETSDYVITSNDFRALAIVVEYVLEIVRNVFLVLMSVSLIVSMFMVNIIVYISTIERKVEIGTLRAIGAKKNNITSIFIGEGIWIGLFAFILSTMGAYLMILIVNSIFYFIIGMPTFNTITFSVTWLFIIAALVLFVMFAASLFPARKASRQNPIDALREE